MFQVIFGGSCSFLLKRMCEEVFTKNFLHLLLFLFLHSVLFFHVPHLRLLRVPHPPPSILSSLSSPSPLPALPFSSPLQERSKWRKVEEGIRCWISFTISSDMKDVSWDCPSLFIRTSKSTLKLIIRCLTWLVMWGNMKLKTCRTIICRHEVFSSIPSSTASLYFYSPFPSLLDTAGSHTHRTVPHCAGLGKKSNY